MIRSFNKLSAQIGGLLFSHHHRLVTAESCTGGWVAKSITDIEGSSQWFDRGFVTYSNDAKTSMLGVKSRIIDRFGAVSEECVKEMVEGALRHSSAQCAVAVTGIAGPSGGSTEKPVGTVWFGWLLENQPTVTMIEHFGGDRETIRIQAVKWALQGLLDVYTNTR